MSKKQLLLSLSALTVLSVVNAEESGSLIGSAISVSEATEQVDAAISNAPEQEEEAVCKVDKDKEWQELALKQTDRAAEIQKMAITASEQEVATEINKMLALHQKEWKEFFQNIPEGYEGLDQLIEQYPENVWKSITDYFSANPMEWKTIKGEKSLDFWKKNLEREKERLERLEQNRKFFEEQAAELRKNTETLRKQNEDNGVQFRINRAHLHTLLAVGLGFSTNSFILPALFLTPLVAAMPDEMRSVVGEYKNAITAGAKLGWEGVKQTPGLIKYGCEKAPVAAKLGWEGVKQTPGLIKYGCEKAPAVAKFVWQNKDLYGPWLALATLGVGQATGYVPEPLICGTLTETAIGDAIGCDMCY